MGLKNWLKKYYKYLIFLIFYSVTILSIIIFANLVIAFIVLGIFVIIAIYCLIDVIIHTYKIRKLDKEIVENE